MPEPDRGVKRGPDGTRRDSRCYPIDGSFACAPCRFRETGARKGSWDETSFAPRRRRPPRRRLRPVDGLWGSDTQSAVERFQRSRGLEPTGTLNAATTNDIRVAAASPAPAHIFQPADATSVRTLQNRLRQLGFYSGPGDGVWGPET